MISSFIVISSFRRCLSSTAVLGQLRGKPGLDPAGLEEARNWMKTATEASLPPGKTSFSRSSGPGGQHVNKTETKATTVWTLATLLPTLPKLLHDGVRKSRFYTKGSDGITIQAQNHRSKIQNAQENRDKLFAELKRIGQGAVPGETSAEDENRWKEIASSATNERMRGKKHQASKKQSRRGGGGNE